MTLHNYRLICPAALLLRNNRPCKDCVGLRFQLPSISNHCYRDSVIDSSAIALTNYVHNYIGTWEKRVSKFITLTSFAKDIFTDSAINVSADKFLIKSNFVYDNGFSFDRNERFLFVGRLSEEKGILFLIECLKNTKYKLDVLGDGPLKNEVIRASSGNNNINYLGFGDKAKVLGLMKSCKALIFPSVWYEGMPMTILEAFSCGCPIVASNIGSMAEIVDQKVNGLLFEPGDKNSLLSSLEALEEEYSENARNTYLAKYTPETNYKNLMKIYQSMLQTKDS
jgi:glycosyltransferase involved in cell wall biosynthesis